MTSQAASHSLRCSTMPKFLIFRQVLKVKDNLEATVGMDDPNGPSTVLRLCKGVTLFIEGDPTTLWAKGL